MKKEKWYVPCMVGLLIIQIFTILYFCNLKQGMHYDEFYSYYSSNVTYALTMPEMGWENVDEIRSEFMVLEDASLDYKMVNLMQSLDVHPPLYYFLLHTVCGLSKGVFSKWQGLAINILFFALSWILLAKIAKLLTNNKKTILAVCLLFGFSPAVYSGITFIRMYMMLTFECLLLLYIHIRASKQNKFTWKNFYFPVMLMAFAGFYTHYYYAVFLFFVAAAVSLYWFFGKETRLQSIQYAFCVCFGMLVTVVVYPSSLKHIFRGYRGTEAMDAFFSFSNLVDRINFFFDLTNEYAFGGMLPLAVILVIVLLLTLGMLKKRKGLRFLPSRELYLVMIVTLGYFLVVAKTALLNAEEAIRYEMPIYGLLILLAIMALEKLPKLCRDNLPILKWINCEIVFIAVAILIFVGQLVALSQKKVCFLYETDKENVAWGFEHKDDAVAYIYNPTNQWMIWDESLELMQYDYIYFASTAMESVTADVQLSAADEIYVYAMRGDAAQEMLENLAKVNGKSATCTKVRELLYCDLYLIK